MIGGLNINHDALERVANIIHTNDDVYRAVTAAVASCRGTSDVSAEQDWQATGDERDADNYRRFPRACELGMIARRHRPRDVATSYMWRGRTGGLERI